MKLTKLSSKPISGALVGAIIIINIATWVDMSFAMLIMAVIVAAVAFVLSVTGADDLMRSKKILRPIGFFVTFFLIAGLWTAGVSDSAKAFFDLLSSISVVSNDNNIYYVYIVMSGGKYVVSTLLALVFLPITCYGDVILSKLPAKIRPAVEAIGVIALLALFVMTVVYSFPQYPEYAVKAFKYFVF